jgi:hypothetical protein
MSARRCRTRAQRWLGARRRRPGPRRTSPVQATAQCFVRRGSPHMDAF